ncbi:MAG TPA: DUF1249 domain-containing protein [Gammaproteobacteria bacterium]|nr:DUF1249 domain-containing protein [Gammaproteobacteria bacterium]
MQLPLVECREYSHLGVYERNFEKLEAAFPALFCGHNSLALVMAGRPDLYVEVLERTRYTSLIKLSQSLGLPPSVRDPLVKVRLYHDARVAEVLAYQNCRHLKAVYPYPNAAMFQPHEKRRVNHFLEEWLDSCLSGNVRIACALKSSTAG